MNNGWCYLILAAYIIVIYSMNIAKDSGVCTNKN